VASAKSLGMPVVMKVVGPVHKSDVGGVVLNVSSEEQVADEFKRLITIKDTTAVLIQPMLSGIELFAGAMAEPKFGHTILCGMGGIFIEVLKDVTAGLAPIGKPEALDMIAKLKSAKIFEGVRGQAGVSVDLFAESIIRLSLLVVVAPEIAEMDLNPLLGSVNRVVTVDARIRIRR
ncbi:MAG: CoA ligase, partial [Bacteroidetes bacterium HGW-Bacteroidetes-22]